MSANNSDFHKADSEPESLPALLIQTSLKTRAFLETCHHAQTLEAFSKSLQRTVWIPLPCNQWSCRFCANKKVKWLACRVDEAQPNRLLTLTVNPAKWDNPRDAFDGTRRKLPDIIKFLRKRFGELEYLRVTELTKKGWPHYHMLIRSPFIPQPVVKKEWARLTGATIVDLRQVNNKFRTYYYMVKYLTKMHKIEWTNRHVSYSKNFFPQPQQKVKHPIDLEDTHVINTHLETLMTANYRGGVLVQLKYNVYGIKREGDYVSIETYNQTQTQPESIDERSRAARIIRQSDKQKAAEQDWLHLKETAKCKTTKK